jgi:hypothetical protein
VLFVCLAEQTQCPHIALLKPETKNTLTMKEDKEDGTM